MSIPIIIRTPAQLKTIRKYAKDNDLPVDIYESFTTYAKYMIPYWTTSKLEWIWAHYEVCQGLQEVFDGTLDYLTIETPPQLGKTALITLFITYVFGSNPDMSHMYFTYNENRATKVTKNNIFKYMGSAKYKKIFPYVVLKNSLNKSDHSAESAMQKKQSTLADNTFNLINPLFDTNDSYRGQYFGFGLGQGAQGNPADLMFLDDYVGKGANINSETFRNNLKSAIYDDIISRFQPGSRFIITCTRWYEDDPIGIIHDGMEDVRIGYEAVGLPPPTIKSIKIRAEYRTTDDNSPNDPRTKDGEFLWLPLLAKFLWAKKSDNYQAMYNCDPAGIENQKQIKPEDFGYYYAEELPQHGRIIIAMDGASTTGKRSDHTAIGAWLIYGRKRYLLKIWYARLEVPKLLDLMVHILMVEFPQYHQCIIEFANSGVPVYQFLFNEMKLRGVIALGFSGKPINDNIKIIKSKKDISSRSNSKVDRYLRMIPEFQGEDKKILLPYEPVEFQDIFIKQIINFTGAKGNSDDLVDMCSYLVNYTTNNTINLSAYNKLDTPRDYKRHNMNYSNASVGTNYFNNKK